MYKLNILISDELLRFLADESEMRMMPIHKLATLILESYREGYEQDEND